MTAPAQDWAERAREVVHKWIDLPWEDAEWSSPQSDRERLVAFIAVALSDAARTGREEGLEEAEKIADRFEMGHAVIVPLIRALRGAQEGETEQAGYFTHPGYDPSVQSGVKEKK